MMLFALLLNIGCTVINGYWFQRALRNRGVYPMWYTVMTGVFTLYCLMNVVTAGARLV